MRNEFLWGSALSLVALGGLSLCLNGCSGRKAADGAAFKRDTITDIQLEDAPAEVVADADNSPVAPVAPAGPKDSRFIIRLASPELEHGAKLTGSVAGKFSADLYRLLWVDAIGRVVGAYELRSVANEKQTNAVIFDISFPAGCVGQNQKLILISAVKDAVQKAQKEKSEPAFTIEGELEFRVQPATSAWSDYIVELNGDKFGDLTPKDAHPLCASGNWAEQVAAYSKTRDAKSFLRQPAIFDEASLTSAKKFIAAEFAARNNSNITGWTFGDNVSLNPGNNPFDFDRSPETLDVFRGWLEERYGSLQSLNLQWGTQFAVWQDVVPPTTDEAKAALNSIYGSRLSELKAGGDKPWEQRNGLNGFQLEPQEIHSAGQENFSAWSDFREFSSFAFGRVHREFRKYLRELSPAPAGSKQSLPRAGMSLTQPSAWGSDLWQISRSIDWAHGYDSVLSRELLRSFAVSTPCVAKLSGQTSRYRLWDGFLRGDLGVSFQLPAEAQQTPEDKALLADLQQLSNGLGALRHGAPIARDAIAIYYSPRSMQLHWMLDSEADGSFWLQRDPAYEAAHSSALLQMNAWMLLLEDLGYSPHFVHPEQVTNGQLLKARTKVVILPKVLALSRAEADALRHFAKAGGIVIADGQCGTFDEHGKRREPETSTLGKGMTRRDVPRPIGILDNEFGIVRKDLSALELNGEYSGDENARVRLRDAISGESIGPDCEELRILEPGVLANAAWSSGASASGAAALISKSGGMGRFIYLNLSLQNYAHIRSESGADGFIFHGMSMADYEKAFGAPRGGEALRILVGDILSEVLAGNPLRVINQDGTPMRGIRRTRWVLGKDSAVFGVLPIGKVEKRGADVLVSGLPITAETQAWASLSKPRHWYDMRKGIYLGHGPSIACSIHPDQAALLTALPYKVERFALKIRRTDPRGSYKVAGDLVADTGHFGRHLVRMDVLSPEGKIIPCYTRNVALQNGSFTFEFALALNEKPGLYRMVIRDIVTGTIAESDLLKDSAEYTQLFP